jgi:hypothetical protein
MTRQIFSPAIFFLLLLNIGCRSTGKITDNGMPDDFIVKLDRSGGKVPDHLLIDISSGDCTMEERKSGTTRKENFRCTKAELEQLYNMSVKYHFYSMTSENRGKVFDRGGVTLEMGSRKQPYKVSDAGSFFLEEQYRQDFKMLVQELENWVMKKVGMN